MSIGLVSIVIPTYNYAQFVPEAVHSALSQTYRHTEVIVVDDGSWDDTRERLAPYRDSVRYIYQDNAGLAAARNKGIENARGDWIALLDSDDVWHPRKLEMQARVLKSNPDLGLLAADQSEDFQSPWDDFGAILTIPTRLTTYQDLVIRTRFGSCGVIMHKSRFDELGGFDVSLRSAEDRDMWIRVAARYPVAVVALPLWKYRLHQQSMSRATERMEQNMARVHAKVLLSPEGARLPFTIRRKALSIDALAVGYGYRDSGAYGHALQKLAESFLAWPLPHAYSDLPMYCARLVFFAGLIKKWIRWRCNSSRVGT